MAQLKKRGRKGGGEEPAAPPPLNNPFAAARKQLQELVVPKLPDKPAPRLVPKPPPAPPPPELSDEELFRQEMFGISPLPAAGSGRGCARRCPGLGSCLGPVRSRPGRRRVTPRPPRWN